MSQHSCSNFYRLRGWFLAFFFSVFVSSVSAAEIYTNFLGIEFVTIPTGSYQMGVPPETTDVSLNEFPQHNVKIPSFPLSKVEITLGQYKKYIVASKRNNIVTDAFMDANARGDQAPVVYVSWVDVQEFIEWLNKNKPKDDKGTYRLPHESEWEYACRAGTGIEKPYCGSLSPSAVAWHKEISGQHQQTVGRKQPNAFGLHDMSGNALEWVEDCYHDSYENAPSDGSAWTQKCASENRVMRGGSWNQIYEKARSTNRFQSAPVNRSNEVGFRLVREI